MKNINEIALLIRDSRLIDIKITYRIILSQKERKQDSVELTFIKNNNRISLKLKNVKQIDIYDDRINAESEYIGHLKCIKDTSGLIWLSLDPFDEHIETIKKNDNYVFGFKDYTINCQPITHNNYES